MARKKKEYDDDDGRTIASMTGVGEEYRASHMLLGGRPGEQSDRKSNSNDQAEQTSPYADRPWEDPDRLTKQETRWFIGGALGAALLIALVFIVSLGLAILIFLLIYGQ